MNGLMDKIRKHQFGLRMYVRLAALFLIVVSAIQIVKLLTSGQAITTAVRANMLIGGVWIFIGVLWLVPAKYLVGMPLFLRNLLFSAAIGFSVFVELNILMANMGSAPLGLLLMLFLVSSFILTIPAVLAFLIVLAEKQP